jgi:hypothetical protein
MKEIKLWIVLLALPAAGFTNCSYFNDVTVPAVDDADPFIGSRVFEPGQQGVILFGNVSYQTHEHDRQWILAPFGFDTGGVQVLSVGTYSDKKCCYPNSSTCAWITSLTQVVGDEEYAIPGDTVSNGRYLSFLFTPRKDGPSGTICDIVRFGYVVQASDFAGNTSTATGSVTYTAPEPIFIDGYTPIVGTSTTGGGGSSCDEAQQGTPCSAVPQNCQPGLYVQGTWQCISGADKCVFPPEGVAGSYCGGPDNGSTRLGCGRGMYEDGWDYGSACSIQGGANRCMPGSHCESDEHPQYGAACAPVQACSVLPTCWLVDQAADVCTADDVL